MVVILVGHGPARGLYRPYPGRCPGLGDRAPLGLWESRGSRARMSTVPGT